MGHIILHSDLNAFYASVECLHRPEIRHLPVAVGGDPEARHGIVLTKNEQAKRFGVKTGEALWQARQKCPRLVILRPNYGLYLQYARLAREIYARYSDRVEPFGLDEAWIDIDDTKDGRLVADEIRARIREELGITASVGVSFNKIFAKLGSDMKKPDATTVVSRENYRQSVWPLSVGDLLYVGPATQRKLQRMGIFTIGQLATLPSSVLRAALGKWGDVLHRFANGLDDTPVALEGSVADAKSIGNSTTTPRDLCCDEDVRFILYVLSESVAARLREQGFRCGVVQLHVRDSELTVFEKQMKLKHPTCLSGEIAESGMQLFQGYDWSKPLRSVGIRGSDLRADADEQLSFLHESAERLKKEKLETTIDDIHRRFGHDSVQRAFLLLDPMGRINAKEDHIIHPIGYHFQEG